MKRTRISIKKREKISLSTHRLEKSKSDIGNFDLTLKLDLEILAGLAIRS
jgi:hypothetical protein